MTDSLRNTEDGNYGIPLTRPAVSWTHPSHSFQRMVALLLMCLLGFGSFFCYDNPAALEERFTNDMGLKESEYVQLYSWYSWPNVICCFIGGFLIDRVFGIRHGTTIYSTIVVVGQLVFALGAYWNSLVVAVLGRFIFGVGAESLAVAQNNYAVLWFKGKELNMVFGFQMSLSRFGSTANMFVMEPLYRFVQQFNLVGYETLGIALFLAGVTCIASLLCSLILSCLDKRAQRILDRRDPGSSDSEVAKLSDVVHFPLGFWMVVVIIVAYYSSIFPFVSLAKKLFMERFHMDDDTANHVNSIVYTISAFLSPLMGFVVDKTGRNLFWVFLSLVLSLVCHFMVGFTMIDPHITMVLMGIAYSMIASALWPLIALVIPEYQLGTAYGIAQSVENLGLALSNSAGGLVVHQGYSYLEAYFMAYLVVASLTIIVLWMYDNGFSIYDNGFCIRMNGPGILNMSASQRSIHEANKLAAHSVERQPMLEESESEDETQR